MSLLDEFNKQIPIDDMNNFYLSIRKDAVDAFYKNINKKLIQFIIQIVKEPIILSESKPADLMNDEDLDKHILLEDVVKIVNKFIMYNHEGKYKFILYKSINFAIYSISETIYDNICYEITKNNILELGYNTLSRRWELCSTKIRKQTP